MGAETELVRALLKDLKGCFHCMESLALRILRGGMNGVDTIISPSRLSLCVHKVPLHVPLALTGSLLLLVSL